MYSANSLSFGAARAKFGPVPDVPRRIRRAFERWFRAIRQALILRALDALVKLCRTVRPPVASDYDWRADTNIYPFDTQTFLTPGQVLKQSAVTQEKIAVVLKYQSPDILPPSPAAVASTYPTQTTSKAMISTAGMYKHLSVIRYNVKNDIRDDRALWLIGPSKRWQTAH